MRTSREFSRWFRKQYGKIPRKSLRRLFIEMQDARTAYTHALIYEHVKEAWEARGSKGKKKGK